MTTMIEIKKCRTIKSSSDLYVFLVDMTSKLEMISKAIWDGVSCPPEDKGLVGAQLVVDEMAESLGPLVEGLEDYELTLKKGGDQNDIH